MEKKHNFSTIYFEATRKCNLECYMCMTGSNNHNFVEKNREKELGPDEIRELIFGPGKALGVGQIAFSGGEFLLRKDAFEILQNAVGFGYRIRITTNATLINDDILLRLKNICTTGMVLAFGINTINEQEVNKKTRSQDIDTTLAALELCKKHNVTRHVVVNVGKFNLEDLEGTYQWLFNNRIAINRSPFSARNSGKDHFPQLAFTARDMEEKIHPVYRKYINGYVSYTPFFLSPELHHRVSGGIKNVTVPQNPAIGCWVGSWIAVNAEGDVAPCAVLLDTLNAGNVREKSLANIIDQSEIFNNILNRDKLKGKCGKCRYQKTCGGCRALAYYHRGDYMDEDPTCFFEPIDGSTVSEHEKETNDNFKKYLLLAHKSGLYVHSKSDKK